MFPAKRIAPKAACAKGKTSKSHTAPGGARSTGAPGRLPAEGRPEVPAPPKVLGFPEERQTGTHSTSKRKSLRRPRISPAGHRYSKTGGTAAHRRLHNRCSAAPPGGSTPQRQKARPERQAPAPGALAGHRPSRTSRGPGSKERFARTNPPIARRPFRQREAPPEGQTRLGTGDTASGCGSDGTLLPGKRQIWGRPTVPHRSHSTPGNKATPI